MGPLAAVAAAAAPAAASAAVALAVAAHAAAGAVATRCRLSLSFAFLRPRRLPAAPVFVLRSGPLVLVLQRWNQRTGTLSGGAGRRAARLIGRYGFAATVFIIGERYRVGLGRGWNASTFRLLVFVRRGGGGSPGSFSS